MGIAESERRGHTNGNITPARTHAASSSQPLPHSKRFDAMSDEKQIVKLQELFA